MSRRGLEVVVFVVLCLLLLEVASQLYARLVIFPSWDRSVANPRHYYHASQDSVLAYELRPDSLVERPDRTLRINHWGIRDDSDDLAPDRWRLAVLGDSVVFGVGQTQEGTLSSSLQADLDPGAEHIRVFNFGLGGLNLAELVEWLRLKNSIYHVNEVVFLVNLNDWARRESVYEGADNGLYRMYRRPAFMSRFFARKAIYRLMKSGESSTGWYRWMFRGNQEWGQQQLRRMVEYVRAEGIVFSVVLLPAGVAYTDQGYALTEVHDRVRSFLEGLGVPVLDPVDVFADHPKRYFDQTDHFHDAGSVKMAALMRDFLLGLEGVVRERR